MKLALEEITVQAGSFRLGPLTLTVAEGEYLVVLGPSGAGKTMTLETIAGLRVVRSGRIMMDGRDITHSAPESRRIGFLFQDSLLFPHLSVRRNIAYGAAQMPRAEREATVARMARVAGVEALLERMPGGLSGGERQRVALARALATNPALMLLDEPMAALDPNSRHDLRATLLELHRELRTTTIHVTHNFAEALALGDRVAILIEGKILQIGPTTEVFSHPASPVIAGFLRSATRAAEHETADPESGAPTICPRTLSLAPSRNGDPGGAPELRADDVLITRGEPGAARREHDVAGRIVAIERRPDVVRLTLNVGLRLDACVARGEPGADSLIEGAAVWVRLPREHR